jgi:hypothetical protein
LRRCWLLVSTTSATSRTRSSGTGSLVSRHRPARWSSRRRLLSCTRPHASSRRQPRCRKVSSTRRSVKRSSEVSLSDDANWWSSGMRCCGRHRFVSCYPTPRGPITGDGAQSSGTLLGEWRPRWLPLTIAVGQVISAARWRRSTTRRCCRADSRHTRKRSSCSSRPPTSGPSCPTRRPAPARRCPASSPPRRGPPTRD